MHATRIVIVVLALAAGCERQGTPTAPFPPKVIGAPVFESCTTICLRPSDCAIGYPDGDTCPAGFRCAFTFQCVADGGTHD